MADREDPVLVEWLRSFDIGRKALALAEHGDTATLSARMTIAAQHPDTPPPPDRVLARWVVDTQLHHQLAVQAEEALIRRMATRGWPPERIADALGLTGPDAVADRQRELAEDRQRVMRSLTYFAAGGDGFVYTRSGATT